MNKKWSIAVGAGVVAIGLALGAAIFAESDESDIRDGTIRVEQKSEADFPALAKISLNQAVEKALNAAPGNVLKTELENEDGFLVYEVKVVTPDKSIRDVKVDAGSGKILALEKEKAHGEEHND